MSTDTNIPAQVVPPRRLWFGFAASVFSWVLLGCLDLIILLLACTHQENFGIPGRHPAVSGLFLTLALALLVVTIAAGFTSYSNWRRLSTSRRLLETQAVERCEFMALLGVIVSITLGMGIIWLALPPFFLDLCWRAK